MRPFWPPTPSLIGLRASVLATDKAIQKNVFGSGICPWDLAKRTILKISNEEMDDIIKTVNSLEESGLLIKVVRKTIENKVKE